MKLEVKKEYEVKGFDKMNSRQKEQVLLLLYMQQVKHLPINEVVKEIINTCYPIEVKPTHPDYNARAVLRSLNKKQLTHLIKNHLKGVN